jgi:hypothetical protein
LKEVGKKFNLVNGRDIAASVRRIQRHRILVAGSFIMGLDTDEPGIGRANRGDGETLRRRHSEYPLSHAAAGHAAVERPRR